MRRIRASRGDGGKIVHPGLRKGPSRPCRGRLLSLLSAQLTDTQDRMATRQERIGAFTHEGSPPADQPLELLCEDHVGTYVIPFLCRWSSGIWHSVETESPIEATVVGWRVR